MRIPTRRREHGLGFDITSLIDIVFMLILFFVVAGILVKRGPTTEVDLQEVVEAEDEDTVPRRLIVTITADEKLVVNEKTCQLAEVEQMILTGAGETPEQFELRVRADRAAMYRSIEPLMLACSKSGVTRIKFAVLRK